MKSNKFVFLCKKADKGVPLLGMCLGPAFCPCLVEVNVKHIAYNAIRREIDRQLTFAENVKRLAGSYNNCVSYVVHCPLTPQRHSFMP